MVYWLIQSTQNNSNHKRNTKRGMTGYNWELCKKFKFSKAEKIVYAQARISSRNWNKILWNFEIEIYHRILLGKPILMSIKKNNFFV